MSVYILNMQLFTWFNQGVGTTHAFLEATEEPTQNKKKSKSEVILFALQTWGIQEDSFKALK